MRFLPTSVAVVTPGNGQVMLQDSAFRDSVLLKHMARSVANHIQKEFSTLDWVLEGMLAHAGFRILRKNVEGLLTAYGCVK